ncbi:MAG TPA: hypothetical protein ENN77_02020 [Candidatus Wirthbacteria bacterium]|nr:hypothetical protein [Candidatus Wirthbacteria bacterium]
MLLANAIVQFLEYLEIEKGRSPLTIRNYDRYLRALHAYLVKTNPKVNISDITLAQVRKFRILLSRKKNQQGHYLAPATINYYLIALRSFLKYLQKNDLTSLAPEKIELAKQTRPQVAVLSVDKLELLLKSAQPQSPDDLMRLRDYAILLTLFSTGLRVQELVSLNRQQVNTKTREFMVRGKGQKDRLIFLSPLAAKHLEQYIQKRKDNYQPLFITTRSITLDPQKKGEELRLTARSIQRIINKYARLAGIVEKVTPHTLRHTFATDLLVNGADIRSVQELLGHASIQTTQVYTHVTNQRLKQVHQSYHGKRLKKK